MKNLISFSAQQPRQATKMVLVAAKAGNANAQAKLAQLLLDGQGIKQDQTLAVKWFSIAAQQNHVEAINMLGRCYENGWGCQVNYVEAAYQYQKATQQGFSWGLYNLANLLVKGLGIKKDLNNAFNLYYKAAQKGHAKSMNLVGRFYEEGWVVKADLNTAIDWYRRSACAGDFRGQCSYASVLTGQGNIDEAILWLKQSMQTATYGFIQKMARALWQSSHEAIKQVAVEMFAHCAQVGDQEDRYTYQLILEQQKSLPLKIG